MRPQPFRQSRETNLALEPVEDIRECVKNAKALEPTQTDKGQQVYATPTDCRRLSGNVGKRVGKGEWKTGDMHTGQTGTVSVGYPRLAGPRVLKPSGILGDT